MANGRYSSPLADAEWNNRRNLGPSWNEGTRGEGAQGVGLSLEPSPHGMHVVSVTPNGLAAETGKVRAGDTLVSINGVDLAGKSAADAIQMLNRAGGTSWSLRLLNREGNTNILVLNSKAQQPSSPASAIPEGAVADTVGVGLTVANVNGSLVVVALSPWGSARWSGRVEKGDIITHIEGNLVESLSAHSAIEMINGTQFGGDTVEMRLLRYRDAIKPGQPQQVVVHLSRGNATPTDTSASGAQYRGSPGHQLEKTSPQKAASPLMAMYPAQPSTTLHSAALSPRHQTRHASPPGGVAASENRALPVRPASLSSPSPADGPPALDRSILIDALERLVVGMADDKSEEVEVPQALLPETAREAQLLKKVFGETSAVKRRGVRAMMLLEQSQASLDKRKEHVLLLNGQLEAAAAVHEKEMEARDREYEAKTSAREELLSRAQTELEETRLREQQNTSTRLQDFASIRESLRREQELEQIEATLAADLRHAKLLESHTRPLQLRIQQLEAELEAERAREPTPRTTAEHKRPEEQQQQEEEREEEEEPGVLVGSAQTWAAMNREGEVVPGLPNGFRFRGDVCLATFSEQYKLCEVRNLRTGKLLYRGPGGRSEESEDGKDGGAAAAAQWQERESAGGRAGDSVEGGGRGGFVGGRKVWEAMIAEGAPITGAPDTFLFRGDVCTRPTYDEQTGVCEVVVVSSGKVVYRGLGINARGDTA